MADELELGDRVITVTKAKDKTISVDPPGVFLYLHRYVRDPASGKERFVFYYRDSRGWRANDMGRVPPQGREIASPNSKVGFAPYHAHSGYPGSGRLAQAVDA